MATDPYAKYPEWVKPAPKKVARLALDKGAFRYVTYDRGNVLGHNPGGEPVVLASPDVRKEPDTDYFVDDDGDLACELQGGGQLWSPPAVTAYHLPAEPLPILSGDPLLSTVRFHEMSFAGAPIFESELLEPARALDAWQSAARIQSASGFTPLICTSRFTANDRIARDESWTKGVHDALATARKVAMPDWLGQRQAGLEEAYDDVAALRDELSRATLARSEGKPPFYFEQEGAYVVLVLIGCPPLDALAWRGFGGWNECPAVDELTALLAHWTKLDRAELVVVGRDYLELRVEQPSDERRKELAWEQFLTASDVVYQGTRTLTALANEMAGGRVFLWWD